MGLSETAALGLRESEPLGQARTDDCYAVLLVESIHGGVVARRRNLLDLTEVAVEAVTGRLQIDRPACPFVGVRVREAVWDIGRGRGKVARSKLGHIVAQLDCQYPFQNEEGVFLCGVDVQGGASPISDVVYN